MLMGALSLVMFVWAGDLDELLTEVGLHGSVDDGDEDDEAGATYPLGAGLAEAEDNEALELVDDPNGEVGEHDENDRDQDDGGE